MYQGRIMGIIPNENIDIEKLGLMMAGTLDLNAEPDKASKDHHFTAKES